MNFIGGFDFERLKKGGTRYYHTLDLDLTTARADQELNLTGNYIHAIDPVGVDPVLQVKFNEQSAAPVNLIPGRSIVTPFFKLYLTNEAQPGSSLKIAFGIGTERAFEIIDDNRESIKNSIDLDNTVNYYANLAQNTTEIISAADNVNGIEILIWSMNIEGGSLLIFDGSTFIRSNFYGSIFLPPGKVLAYFNVLWNVGHLSYRLL